VILQAEEGPADFHARFGAKAKTYEYRILNRTVRSPCTCDTAGTWDWPWTWTGCGRLPGSLWEHDFAGFQSGGSFVQTTTRKVLAASWEEKSGGWKIFRISASGFCGAWCGPW
jgi:tRNA pseudouridine38-40 synthase